MADGGVARELCTPTGAAILAATVTALDARRPTGTPVAVGWGAGDADLADRANVLRVVVIEPAAATTCHRVADRREPRRHEPRAVRAGERGACSRPARSTCGGRRSR